MPSTYRVYREGNSWVVDRDHNDGSAPTRLGHYLRRDGALTLARLLADRADEITLIDNR